MRELNEFEMRERERVYLLGRKYNFSSTIQGVNQTSFERENL